MRWTHDDWQQSQNDERESRLDRDALREPYRPVQRVTAEDYRERGGLAVGRAFTTSAAQDCVEQAETEHSDRGRR